MACSICSNKLPRLLIQHCHSWAVSITPRPAINAADRPDDLHAGRQTPFDQSAGNPLDIFSMFGGCYNLDVFFLHAASVAGIADPGKPSPIASYIADEPFRGQRGQQTRLEQPCLRLKLEHWQCRYQ